MDIHYDISHVEHEAYIRHLAPPGVLTLVGQAGFLTIAAIRTTETGLQRAVGMLMFLETEQGDRRLIYLFVDKPSRGRGIGKQLLSYYRQDAGFPYIVTIEDIMSSKLMMQALRDKSKNTAIKSLKAFSNRQAADALRVLTHGSGVGLSELRSADKDLSLLSIKENTPRGMVIVQSYGEVNLLRAVLAAERSEAIRLMEVLTLRLVRRMDADLFFSAEDLIIPDDDRLLEKFYTPSQKN